MRMWVKLHVLFLLGGGSFVVVVFADSCKLIMSVSVIVWAIWSVTPHVPLAPDRYIGMMSFTPTL